jgi:hypothetical protein
MADAEPPAPPAPPDPVATAAHQHVCAPKATVVLRAALHHKVLKAEAAKDKALLKQHRANLAAADDETMYSYVQYFTDAQVSNDETVDMFGRMFRPCGCASEEAIITLVFIGNGTAL